MQFCGCLLKRYLETNRQEIRILHLTENKTKQNNTIQSKAKQNKQTIKNKNKTKKQKETKNIIDLSIFQESYDINCFCYSNI